MAKIEKNTNSEIKFRDDSGKLHTFTKKVFGDGYTDHNGKTLRKKTFGSDFEYKDSKSGTKETFRKSWNNKGYVGNKGTSINGSKVKVGRKHQSNRWFTSSYGKRNKKEKAKLGLGSTLLIVALGALAFVSPFNVGGIWSKGLILGALITLILNCAFRKIEWIPKDLILQTCCSICIIGALYFDLQNPQSFARLMAIVGIALYIGLACLLTLKFNNKIVSLSFCAVNYLQYYLILSENYFIVIVVYVIIIIALSLLVIYYNKNGKEITFLK